MFNSTFLKINEIVGDNGILPISKASWYRGIKEGYYPEPVKIGKRASVWRSDDIQDLIERMNKGELNC